MDWVLIALIGLSILGLIALGMAGYWQFHPPDWWRWPW